MSHSKLQDEVVRILRVRGGPSYNKIVTLAPVFGPLGISPRRIAGAIDELTTDWDGIKVTVRVVISNRNFKCELVPTVSELIIQALREPPVEPLRRRDVVVRHDGNLTLSEVVAIARQVLGSCVSIGCTVDGESPKIAQQKITDGTIEFAEDG